MQELVDKLFMLVLDVAPILTLIGMVFTFNKAGTAGWKAILPYYNEYTIMKLGNNMKHKILFFIAVIGFLIMAFIATAVVVGIIIWFFICVGLWAAPEVTETLDKLVLVALPISVILLFAFNTMYFVVQVINRNALCKKLLYDGRPAGTGIVWGLVLLPPVFWMIIGLNSRYQFIKEPEVTQAPIMQTQDQVV